LGVGVHAVTLLLGALMATVGHSSLVLAAKHDPRMWRVYARHVGYQPYYPARALEGAPVAEVAPFRLER
jgi:type IV secretory pathway TrbD component